MVCNSMIISTIIYTLFFGSMLIVISLLAGLVLIIKNGMDRFESNNSEHTSLVRFIVKSEYLRALIVVFVFMLSFACIAICLDLYVI